LFALLAGAQQQAPPLKVTKIKDNVYWAQGGVGSNDGIIVGSAGVIVVDTKTTPDSEKEVIAEIAKITPKTVNTAIITHSDGDHVNGLAAFPAGLTIIAQENCKKEMEASAGSRNPAPQDRLPTKTYTKTDKLTTNDWDDYGRSAEPSEEDASYGYRAAPVLVCQTRMQVVLQAIAKAKRRGYCSIYWISDP